MKKSILKKVFNIIFYILIIVILCLTININTDYTIVKKRVLINNEASINKYKSYKFVTLDLSKSTETRFSVTDNDKLKSIIYTVKYGKKDYLIELSPTTVITNKVDVMRMEDNSDISLLKGDLATESDNKLNFGGDYYTNINLEENERIVRYKVLATRLLLCTCLGFISVYFISLVVSLIFKKSDNLI